MYLFKKSVLILKQYLDKSLNEKKAIFVIKFIDYLSLGNHPCADTFLKVNIKQKLKKYPLVVGYCKCSHMTSVFPVPSSERYENMTILTLLIIQSFQDHTLSL